MNNSRSNAAADLLAGVVCILVIVLIKLITS